MTGVATTAGMPAVRERWGAALQVELDRLGWSRTDLRLALAGAGVTVTKQAISKWLRGESAPRIEHQPVVARVVGVAHHVLFSVEAVA